MDLIVEFPPKLEGSSNLVEETQSEMLVEMLLQKWFFKWNTFQLLSTMLQTFVLWSSYLSISKQVVEHMLRIPDDIVF
jgi:hypothetical protein